MIVLARNEIDYDGRCKRTQVLTDVQINGFVKSSEITYIPHFRYGRLQTIRKNHYDDLFGFLSEKEAEEFVKKYQLDGFAPLEIKPHSKTYRNH